MTPEAKQAIEQITELTGNRTETLRALCEASGHEPAEIACMAINRMYIGFIEAGIIDEPEPAEAAEVVPESGPISELDTILEQLRAAGERQQAVKAKYAP